MDIFKNVDFNDRQLQDDNDCRLGMCLIGRHLMHRTIQDVALDWRKKTGDLLQADDQEIRFFGGLFRMTTATDGSVQLFQTRVDGKELAVSRMPLTLENLPGLLRGAADYLVDRLQYEEIARITGLPNPIVVAHAPLYSYGHYYSFRQELLQQILAGEKFDDLAARTTEAAHGRLSKEGRQMARKCQSDAATLETYNFCMKHQTMAQQLMHEAQQLLPLVYAAYTAGDLKSVDCNTLKTLKAAMLAKGMPEAGWKLLAHMPVADLRWLTNKYAFARLVEIADFLARTQVMPPMPLLRRWLEDMHRSYRPAIPPTWLRRAAAIEAGSKGSWPELKMFINNEYANVLDWVRANPLQPDANQLRAGWKWIRRQSDEWHTRISERGAHRGLAWISLVDAYEDGDYRVVPLTTSAALAAEGSVMHHCVGSYDYYAVRGYSRIFSFRDATGKSIATGEISLSGDRWQFSQVRGSCNADPGKPFRDMMDRLIRRYNLAYTRFLEHDPNAGKAAA